MTLISRLSPRRLTAAARRAAPWWTPLLAWGILAAIGHPSSRPAFYWAQVLAGAWVVSAIGLAAWAHCPPTVKGLIATKPDPLLEVRHRSLLIALWAIAVAVPSATLTGRPLALFAAVAVGALANGRRGAALAVGALAALQVAATPFKGSELFGDSMHALYLDTVGPLQLAGRHGAQSELAQIVGAAPWLGSAYLSAISKQLAWPAHAMAQWGLVPMAALLACIEFAWCAASLWLARTTMAARQSDWRLRVLLALALMCTTASIAGAMFTGAFTRNAFGPGLLPWVDNKAWWVVLASLVVGCGWLVLKSGLTGLAPPLPGTRRAWIKASVAMVGLLFGLHLYGLWRVKDEVETAAARTATNKTAQDYPRRKAIVDRHSLVLAHDVDALDLSIKLTGYSERCGEDQDCGLTPLKPMLDKIKLALEPDPDALDQVLYRTGPSARLDHVEGRITLAKGVDTALAVQLNELDIAELKLAPSRTRRYSQGNLFAHAVGFVQRGLDGHGLEGVERAADDDLATVSKQRYATVDPDAADVLTTTLDRDAQLLAHDALTLAMRNPNALGAAAVVLDARTGAVRALVSVPDFDPNRGSTFRAPLRTDRLLNRALAVPIAAGSLMAPMAVAEALEQGQLSSRSIMVPPKSTSSPPPRHPGRPSAKPVTLEHLLATNAEAAEEWTTASWTSPELHSWLQKLFEALPPNVGLPQGIAEASPDFDEETPPVLRQLWTLSLRLNLVQLMGLYLPLASDGVTRPIHAVASLDTDDCDASRVVDLCRHRRLWSPETAHSIRRMLAMAAQGSGMAPSNPRPAAEIAGLSAWSPAVTNSGTTPEWHGVAMGMVPADKPRWLVGVLVTHREQPQTDIAALEQAASRSVARIAQGLTGTAPEAPRTTAKP